MNPEPMNPEPMNVAERAAGLAATPGYRYADSVGDELYVAGQVPHDADGNIVGLDDTGRQATQCLDNLTLLIEVRGFSQEHVRRLVVYVVGEDLRGAWDAMRQRFPDGVPPATLLGVARLGHIGQLVEIDAIIRR
jgi:enamine deaminase RidA (YjgF/YER057c/UK114 family)